MRSSVFDLIGLAIEEANHLVGGVLASSRTLLLGPLDPELLDAAEPLLRNLYTLYTLHRPLRRLYQWASPVVYDKARVTVGRPSWGNRVI